MLKRIGNSYYLKGVKSSVADIKLVTDDLFNVTKSYLNIHVASVSDSLIDDLENVLSDFRLYAETLKNKKAFNIRETWTEESVNKEALDWLIKNARG